MSQPPLTSSLLVHGKLRSTETSESSCTLDQSLLILLEKLIFADNERIRKSYLHQVVDRILSPVDFPLVLSNTDMLAQLLC